jgi:hypothetical protein
MAGNPRELGLNIPDLRHRAESGSAVAQTILGICYLEGVQVEVDHQEAFRLLSAAANQGASRAMANLAYMYAEGLGTTKSLQEALPLYERAADAGEFLAQVELARMYARGVAITANPEMARKWRLAADYWPHSRISPKENAAPGTQAQGVSGQAAMPVSQPHPDQGIRRDARNRVGTLLAVRENPTVRAAQKPRYLAEC